MSVPLPNWTLAELTLTLERAGLHGHGGAYFPTATKLNAVAGQNAQPVVVVNATEGEPLSSKDRFLLTQQADIVLDGALMAARALKSQSITVAVDERRVRLLERVDSTIAGRPELNRRGLSTTVTAVPCGYVSGQETALVQALSGRSARPILTPPFPFERGVGGRPTLVSNAETFAQIGQIARGSFRGWRLITVSGAVMQRSVVQVAGQSTVADALAAAGGVREELQGVLMGGYAGTWARVPEALGLRLDEPQLRQHGLTIGAGILFALGSAGCPVAEVARVARWMAGQSAGQCGPCVYGLDAIASTLEELTRNGAPGAPAQLRRWAQMVSRRGACAHPDGVARFVSTALDVFGPAFEDHARNGGCERCDHPAILPVPSGGGHGFAAGVGGR